MSAKSQSASFILSVLKGVVITLLAVLVGVLIFALIVKLAMLSNGVIKAVNQFIKAVAIFIGCLSSIMGNKGLIKGALVGLFGTVLTFLVFALFGGEISFGLSFFIDIIFGSILGAISGVVAVNVRSK